MRAEALKQASATRPHLDVTVSAASDDHLARWRVHTAGDGHLVHGSVVAHQVAVEVVDEEVTLCAAVQLTVDRVDVDFFHPVVAERELFAEVELVVAEGLCRVGFMGVHCLKSPDSQAIER